MTIWLLADGNPVDVVIEPHLGETFTVCAHSAAVLEPLVELAPEPAFETVFDTKFKWAVHIPMHRVMPDGWEFLDSARTFTIERLVAPISPNPAQWFWEAAKVFDEDGTWLDTPEGYCGYELLKDPAILLEELQNSQLQDIALIPVYGERFSDKFLDKSAEEWDVWTDEWEGETEEDL